MTGMLMAQIPTPTIVKKSPALDALIAPDAAIEKLGDGFEWTEGPGLGPKGGFLLFSDIPNNAINKWKQGEGHHGVPEARAATRAATPFTGREPGSNGLTFDAQGRLVMCQHGDRRVARLEARRQVHDARRPVRGQAVQQPERPRLQVERRPLLHRSAVRPAEALRRPGEGARRSRASIASRRRHGHAAHQGDDAPERHRASRPTRRRSTSRTPIRRRRSGWRIPVKADGTLGEGRVLRRRHARSARPRSRPARRHEGRHEGQPLRDRPRRRAGSSRPTARTWALSTRRATANSRGATTARRSTSRRTRRCSG